MAKTMTIPDLADEAGVAARSISNIERGDSGARPETVRSLAGALGIAPEELLLKEPAASAPVPRPSTPKIEIPPPKPAPRTRLDVLADLVRARKLTPAPVTVGKKKVAALDPVAMQNLFARHAAFAGKSFVVVGRVEQQRALSVAEARALKTRVGVGARYRVFVEVIAGETLDVTVHAVDAALAGALQAKMGESVRVLVEVRVVGKNDARVVSLFASARKRAWALVGVSVM